MKCPKCSSENITAKMVSETTLNVKRHGCLYWVCVGWWLKPILWLFLTMPMIFVKIFRPKKYKTKTTHTSMWVCQSCGNNWRA